MLGLRTAAIGLAALIFLAAPAAAQVFVVSPDSGTLRTGSNFTLGSSFTVGANPVRVTSLGVWDSNSDGLAASKQVGIWDSTQTLVASATVPAGTGGTLVGEFRYTPITPIILSANTGYTVGAFYPTGDADQLHDHLNGSNPATPTMSSDFSGYVARFDNAAGFSDPTGGTSGPAYVGPSFQYAVVPEPSSLALALAGAGLLGIRRRTARRP
jgi:hypothetical protein